ncbi:MAG: beta-lactamase family protein [Lachnospiraceae bacterium]|nr:beta-lactamase family protein [Lachnospiraceae bacterium]
MNFDRLKEYQDSLSKIGIAGNDLAIYVGYDEVYRYQTGFADLENRRPIDSGTLYKMYSMTKPITVTAAMQLVEEGRLLIDHPLYEYLPEFREMNVAVTEEDGSKRIVPAENPIYIHQLFSMTAGFSYDYKTPEFLALYERTGGQHTLSDVVSTIAKQPLYYEPGTRFLYSMGHDVLARVVEVITGKNFGAYIRERIFDPLGMEKASHHPSEEEMKRCAKTYTLNEAGDALVPGEPESTFWISPKFEGGGAGIICTIDEYAKFTKMLTHRGVGENGNRILTSRSVELIRTNRLSGKPLEDYQHSSQNRRDYGYGLGVRTLLDPAVGGSLSSVGEFGWGGALGTYMLADPSSGVSVVYGQQASSDERRPSVTRPLRNIIYASLEYAGLI